MASISYSSKLLRNVSKHRETNALNTLFVVVVVTIKYCLALFFCEMPHFEVCDLKETFRHVEQLNVTICFGFISEIGCGT